jgi:saccharopine dehydrogenase-like NADP-dependent oxidoreductase
MEYAVLGTGGIGQALILDVLATYPDVKVRAYDQFDSALARLGRIEAGDRLTCQRLDAGSPADLLNAISSADIVINTTDGSRSVDILDACIAAGRPYLDVHGTLLVNERLDRDEAARHSGITALIGMGCSPGITNMLGAYGARHGEGDVEIAIEYFTQRPLNPSVGLLDTILRQFRDHVRAYEFIDGKHVLHPPFADPIRTRFPGVEDEVELVRTPHSEPQTLPRFVPGLRRVSVHGAYQPEIMYFIKSLSRFGLLREDLKTEIDGTVREFAPILRNVLMADGVLMPAAVKTIYCLRIRVTSTRSGFKRVVETTVGHPQEWDPLPQARMTAIPAAYTARLLATGQLYQPGVIGPEMFDDKSVEGCLTYLRERGLWTIIESHETQRSSVAPHDG